MVNEQDIIQITDENHPWFPALLIVSEVKNWGVQAYCIIPQNNSEAQSCAQAFLRLKDGSFEVVGNASVVTR